MKRVTGLGGFFIKTENKEALAEWYRNHLDVETHPYGYTFNWKDKDTGETGNTVYSLFEKKSEYFKPSQSQFMVNFRVEDLEKLLGILAAEGVNRLGEMETYSYGKFAWILDPDGNKIELWEPMGPGF